MTAQQEQLLLVLLCLLVVLLSLGGLAWSFQAALLLPQITMDGLLLVLICLTMATVFAAMLYSIAKRAGWLETLLSWSRKNSQQASAEFSPKSAEAQSAGAAANPSSQGDREES